MEYFYSVSWMAQNIISKDKELGEKIFPIYVAKG